MLVKYEAANVVVEWCNSCATQTEAVLEKDDSGQCYGRLRVVCGSSVVSLETRGISWYRVYMQLRELARKHNIPAEAVTNLVVAMELADSPAQLVISSRSRTYRFDTENSVYADDDGNVLTTVSS